MSKIESLKCKIETKEAVVGVIGLGYVGLPLAVAFAEAGFVVIGVDYDEEKVNAVNTGKSYIEDIPDDRLRGVLGSLVVTETPSSLNNADAVCICVPTPMTSTKQPDLTYIIEAVEGIKAFVEHDCLLVLESTSYPGTLRQVVEPILVSEGGRDFHLAFSPEMIDPRNVIYSLENTTKLVGGLTPEATDLAVTLYQQVVTHGDIYPVSSPEVAEMAKVFTNVFRSVNIALVNDLAMLCEKLSVSVWEVLDAASRKPFGFMKFLPGLGVGGHCVPIDPHYLDWVAVQAGYHPKFIQLAAMVNDGMPEYILGRIMLALNSMGKTMWGSKILVLGVAYKPNVADIRESPSITLMDLLERCGAEVSYHDPYVPTLEDWKDSVDFDVNSLSDYDCVVIATWHDVFDVGILVSYANLVFDTRGVTVGIESANVVRLGE